MHTSQHLPSLPHPVFHFSRQSGGEGDPRWVVESRDDGKNVNGWHWEEKNIKAWGRQRLIELLSEVSADLEGGGCIRVTQLKDLVGEASITIRKGNKRFAVFDLTLLLSWERVAETEVPEEVKVVGEVKVEEVSSSGDSEDYVYSVTAEGTGTHQGHVEAASELLTGPGRKLVLKVKNKDGHTPLHLAARAGHIDVVQRLLDAGARADSKDKGALATPGVSSMRKAGCAPVIDEATSRCGLHPSGSCASLRDPSATAAAERFEPRGPPPTPPPGLTPPSRSANGAAPPATAPSGSSAPATAAGLLPPAAVSAVASPAAASRVGLGSGAGAAGRARKGAGGGSAAEQGSTPHKESSPPTSAHERTAHGGAGAEVAALSGRLQRFEAGAAAQVEMGSQLAEALAAVEQQSRQMVEMEKAMSEQAAMMQAFISSLEGLQERVQQKDTPAAAQEEAEKQRLVQDLAGEVLGLKQQLAAVEAADANNKLAALTTQVQQLSSRPALQPAVESLERKVGELREAGLPDKMELLQLKLAQITAPVAALTKQHEHMSSQLAALQLQALNNNSEGSAQSAELMEPQPSLPPTPPTRSLFPADPAAPPSPHADAPTLAGIQARLDATDARLDSMQTALGTAHMMSAGTPAAAAAAAAATATPASASAATSHPEAAAEPSAPLSTVIELQEQLASLHSVVAGLAAKQEAAGTGAGSSASSPGSAGKPGSDLGSPALKAQLSELKASLHELKRSTAAELDSVRRTHKEASGKDSGRYTEQNVELSQREANLRSLRDDLLTTENKRQERVQLDAQVAAQLKQLELDVGLLTHQVEVLDDQMDCQIQLQQTSRSNCGSTFGELPSPRLHSKTGPPSFSTPTAAPHNTPLQPQHTHTQQQQPPQQQQHQQQQQQQQQALQQSPITHPTQQKQQQQQQEAFTGWHAQDQQQQQQRSMLQQEQQHHSVPSSYPLPHGRDSDSSNRTPTRTPLHSSLLRPESDHTRISPSGAVAETLCLTPSALPNPSSSQVAPPAPTLACSPAPHTMAFGSPAPSLAADMSAAEDAGGRATTATKATAAAAAAAAAAAVGTRSDAARPPSAAAGTVNASSGRPTPVKSASKGAKALAAGKQ
ncbi:MAG: hypothetical protein WDW36_010222 [Sanguina aurantia]